METQLSWEPEKPKPGKLIFSLTVPGRLPSWNDILGMEQWARYKFKNSLAKDFLSELRRSERGSLTGTTCAKSTTSIFSATLLERHLETARQQRKSRSARKKLKLADAKKSELKFTKPEPLPF